LLPLGLLAAAVTKKAIESATVEFGVSLQMRRRPFASWLAIHQRELALEFALYALGALAAFTIALSPFAVALFAIPVAIIGWALNERVRLSRQTTAAIFKLADLVDARDPYTRGHSVRVAATAERLAKKLKLQPLQIDVIRTASRVHDIGKAATDDDVLLKPSALDQAEMDEMHAHSDHGATLLAALPDFYEGAELVRAHHERVDGKGYPRGLRGSEIPLEVGVVAVADAYDAMTNDRPYRRALTWAQSRVELMAGRGVQWDARIVDAFVEMIDDEQTAPARSQRPITQPAS
jgi:putative nucleotidyltransferase with HDIG domain